MRLSNWACNLAHTSGILFKASWQDYNCGYRAGYLEHKQTGQKELLTQSGPIELIHGPESMRWLIGLYCTDDLEGFQLVCR